MPGIKGNPGKRGTLHWKSREYSNICRLFPGNTVKESIFINRDVNFLMTFLKQGTLRPQALRSVIHRKREIRENTRLRNTRLFLPLKKKRNEIRRNTKSFVFRFDRENEISYSNSRIFLISRLRWKTALNSRYWNSILS